MHLKPDGTPYRGSRKHILDWVEHPAFLSDLRRMVAQAPCDISDDALFMPRGYDAPQEARLTTFGQSVLPHDNAWDALRNWWLPEGAAGNTPNWDLVVQCRIGGEPGLILVEAKANTTELSKAGKAPFRMSARTTAESLAQSSKNLRHVEGAIEAANVGLDSSVPGVKLSTKAHYQLSNRLAFAWKLAERGIPSVVIYLGFLRDVGLRASLRDSEHWARLFRDHLIGVCPNVIGEEPIKVGNSEFWLLCRDRPILSPSPPSPNSAA